MQKEIWKPVLQLWSFDSQHKRVKLYEIEKGRYYVSDLGRFMRDGKIIDAKPDKVGTKTFKLSNHRFKLHQIVLQTFYPEEIADGLSPDHISRDRSDNRLSNLRWASREMQYTNRNNEAHNKKNVLCKNNNLVYSSCKEAEEDLGLVRNTVARVARGERKSIHGYKFTFI